MKTVPVELLTQLGSEPQLEVDIAWDRVNYTTYDRDKIVNNPTLNVQPSSKTGTASSISIELDDADGVLLDLIDITDVHKVPAKLYLKGRLLLFTGEITGPITWSEAERTISFSIESKIEDREVGFSLEESAVGCDKESIGKPWPLCFGSVVHAPATQVSGPQTGTLLNQMGIVDPLILPTLQALEDAAAQEAYILRFQQQVIEAIKAMIPSIEEVFAIYVAAMVRRRQLIALRDAFIAQQQGIAGAPALQDIIDAYELFMQNIVGGKWNLRVWRRKHRKVLEGAGMGVMSEMELVGNFLLMKVNAFFEWFKEFADTVPMVLQLFKDTLRRTHECIENMQKIWAQYYQLQYEYCRQLDLVKDEVEINCGTNFPQNEEITIHIDDFGWKGVFTEETFTFTTPGVPVPLYEDLEIREWYVQNRACGTVTDWSDINIFYLVDPTVNLVGKYILVSKTGSNYRHVLKVESQEQFRGDVIASEIVRSELGAELFTACTFTLVAWPQQEGEYQLRRPGQRGSNVQLPIYGSPFAVGGMPTPTLLAPVTDYVNSIGLTPAMIAYIQSQGIFQITEEELRDLQAIFEASELDNIINAPILWTMPTPEDTFTIIGSQVSGILKAAKLPTADWWTAWDMGTVTFSGSTLINAELKHNDKVIFETTGTLPSPLEEDKWYVVREISGSLYLANSYPSKDEITLTTAGSGTHTVKLYSPINKIELPSKLDWSVNPGQKVYGTGASFVYVANLVPSQIHSIMAYRKVDEEDVLQHIHRELYSYNESEDVDPFSVTSVRLLIRPSDFGWSDQIYVTLESSVGPNVVDIIRHLIVTYTGFSIDETTFTNVRLVVDPYPCHFGLFTRKNILEQLHEIAWQCCLQLDLINDTFYLRYLPTEPAAVDTLGNYVIEKSLTFNETADLVTKMHITWREDYLPDNDLEFILRHNIKKYGLHESNYDWYVYTNRNLIIRAATYWMLRQSNTWKYLECTTPLGTLEWDVGDGITIEGITGIISQASYNFDQHTISYTIWQPIRSGEVTAYQFAWPADVGPTVEFPTVVELEYSGSPGPGRTVATLPTGIP